MWKDVAVARSGGPVRQLLPEPTATGLELGPSRYAFGASSSADVNIQGLHGSNVLIIADEAPDIYRRIGISAFDTSNFQTVDGRTITEEELAAMTPEELTYRPFPSLVKRE
jgi:hypothetical protein